MAVMFPLSAVRLRAADGLDCWRPATGHRVATDEAPLSLQMREWGFQTL
jgi:hypothetical protein